MAAISLGLALAGIAALAILAVVAIWLIPKRQARRWQRAGVEGPELAGIENSTRGTLVQLVGGVALILTFAATWAQINDARRASEESLEATRTQQRNERFSRALDQLASSRLENRVAAIASLGGVADEARSSERESVVQIVLAYLHTIRRSTPRAGIIPVGIPAPDCSKPLTTFTAVRPDTQAAVDVLLAHADLHSSRHPLSQLDFKGLNSPSADFGGANLRSSFLVEASLNDARFSNAALDAARFTRACLRGASFDAVSAPGARFVGADLSGADFSGAALERADFPNANLTDASFDSADLTLANLSDAVLSGASFTGANLSNADLRGTGVTRSQLHDATVDVCTMLPWHQHISEDRCSYPGSFG